MYYDDYFLVYTARYRSFCSKEASDINYGEFFNYGKKSKIK